jgi:hypothetical protein
MATRPVPPCATDHAFDHFSLEQSDHGLGQRVIERIADRPDRRVDLDLAEAFG